jgi:hypothetical protein
VNKKDYGDLAIAFGAGMGLAALVTIVYAAATKSTQASTQASTTGTLLQTIVPVAATSIF